MPEEPKKQTALSANAAYQLADVSKTPPQYDAISPRWFTRLLEWKPLEAGIFRLNRVRAGENLLDVLCSQANQDEIPAGFLDYEPQPREYVLHSISAIINIDSRVADLYSSPYDQAGEQLRLATESLRERQESLLINSTSYGLLPGCVPEQRIKPRQGTPTPDDLDELLSRVWKEPTFFLAHPAAIAAFGRECTRRGVPPPIVEREGGTFISWRGVPLVPTDKLLVDGKRRYLGGGGRTNILLVRTGEQKQGVIGLYQTGLTEECSRGLSARFMGVDEHGVCAYLLSLYCSTAVLADDALGVLEDVEVGVYHDR